MKEFKNWLILQGYAQGTISTYTVIVKGILSKIKGVTEEELNNYFLSLNGNCPIETYNVKIKAIRLYLKSLKLALNTPKLKKVPFTLPKSISLEYLEESLIPMVDMTFRNPVRVRTLLYFMFFTGLRKSEIYALKRKDFDLEQKRVKIYEQKTKQERIVFYPDFVKQYLEGYFKLSPEKENAFNLGKGSIDYIFTKLKPYCKEVNLTPHIFRHSFATYLAKKKMNLKYLKELMGHKNIKTTERYITANPDDLQDAYNKIIRKRR